MGTLSDQLPPFGPVTTLQDATSHDIHEDWDNGEWCAIYTSVSWTLQFIDTVVYVERYSDGSTGSDDLQPPPAKKWHQEGM